MKNEISNIDKAITVISLKDLNKSFDDLEVLKGIDLEVYKGENVVILGRSGSGKSVLIKIIAGLLQPDNGHIKILGQDVAQLDIKTLHALRLKIGFSFQSSALYDGMTVWENIEFPLVRNKRNLTRKQVNEAIDQVLDDVGLRQTVDQMPAELSGGQKKRIGIARMLVLQPEIILYDEPTGGLDPITCVEINRLIKEVQEQYNTSSIIITHDLTCARSIGDRIVMLADGKFLKQGSFDEVFSTDDSRIRAFYDYNFILDQ
ncbi:ATP-binding cassette domain-containing protein [Chitinophaga polysaccharea]|uniref:ABC transporter ATP-binding protein n=1 Tax=Chitinophaga TaxID=79328 RepID=UPI0014559B8C|nr:ATP-binding cassette domain-containing protein [Chitinophaga sp. Ak27]NLR60567.1 ATP-binding cassette domain-containing protein [Chitinophaga polysaccharea]NLU90536.1 ATP-binding cassette domain-containing protein [Chitinophaga sp. Ak27]